MKIYFEDGWLNDKKLLDFKIDNILNASAGYTETYEALEKILKYNQAGIVYTNSLVALSSSKYFWDSSSNMPLLYIRSDKSQPFTLVTDLTNRELKQSHNYLKLFMNGEFRQDKNNRLVEHLVSASLCVLENGPREEYDLRQTILRNFDATDIDMNEAELQLLRNNLVTYVRENNKVLLAITEEGRGI